MKLLTANHEGGAEKSYLLTQLFCEQLNLYTCIPSTCIIVALCYTSNASIHIKIHRLTSSPKIESTIYYPEIKDWIKAPGD